MELKLGDVVTGSNSKTSGAKMDVQDDLRSVSSDDNSENEEKEDEVTDLSNLELDLGYLAGYNTNPLSSDRMKTNKEKEEYLKELATAGMDAVLRNLCETAKSQGSISTVALPKPTTRLPRQKPIPMKKDETKWEKFAKEKGITNKKRERMIWDDETQTWKPRWGYKRINDEQKEWVVEVKSTEDPMVDQFQKKRASKKMRVLKNRQKQLRNQERQMKSLPAGIATDLAGRKGRGKERTLEALRISQSSTGSLGRFDPELQGEPKRKIGSKKRYFKPNEKLDSDRVLKLLKK